MAGGAVAAAAAIAHAIKASGVLVRVSPPDFAELLDRADAPLVVVAQGGVIKKHFKYLMSYKGLAFFTKTEAQFVLPRQCETVVADKIWVPD